ncbi:MAG: hypothetical protein DK302_001655 [Chloroflexi bacterium]|jgi:hypothetical protein|nr:MAG: hypothetical protein DK302_001655 [Chloroflexota bacterium]
MNNLVWIVNKKDLIGTLLYASVLTGVIALAACGGGSDDQQAIDSQAIPTASPYAITPEVEIQSEIDTEQETRAEESNVGTRTSTDVAMDADIIDISEAPTVLGGTSTPLAGSPTASPEEFATATPFATPIVIGAPTSTPIPVATATAFATPTVVGEGTPTPFPTPTGVVQATATPTPLGTATPFATPTPYEEPTPAGTATPFVTATPFATPTPIN